MPATLTPERARLRRGRAVTALVALALLLVLGLVWALGGFERRQDQLSDVAPGTVLTSGPYALTLTGASVQHVTDADRWEVVVVGSAQTTGDTTITPPTGEAGFVYAQDRTTREVQPVYAFALGRSGDVATRQDSLTPGLAPVELTATFRFSAPPVGETLRVVVFEQDYTAPYVFGDERAWRATGEAYDLDLPLRRLPDRTY